MANRYPAPFPEGPYYMDFLTFWKHIKFLLKQRGFPPEQLEMSRRHFLQNDLYNAYQQHCIENYDVLQALTTIIANRSNSVYERSSGVSYPEFCWSYMPVGSNCQAPLPRKSRFNNSSHNERSGHLAYQPYRDLRVASSSSCSAGVITQNLNQTQLPFPSACRPRVITQNLNQMQSSFPSACRPRVITQNLNQMQSSFPSSSGSAVVIQNLNQMPPSFPCSSRQGVITQNFNQMQPSFPCPSRRVITQNFNQMQPSFPSSSGSGIVTLTFHPQNDQHPPGISSEAVAQKMNSFTDPSPPKNINLMAENILNPNRNGNEGQQLSVKASKSKSTRCLLNKQTERTDLNLSTTQRDMADRSEKNMGPLARAVRALEHGVGEDKSGSNSEILQTHNSRTTESENVKGDDDEEVLDLSANDQEINDWNLKQLEQPKE